MSEHAALKETVGTEMHRWADEHCGGIEKMSRTDPSPFACWFVTVHPELAKAGLHGCDHLRIFTMAEEIRREALWGKSS